MAIQIFNDKHGTVYKDTAICEEHAFLSNGQGCDTIYFKSVPLARKALKKDGVKSGRDFFDCTKCGCHYSHGSRQHEKYPEHACHDLKCQYAKSFES